jgi:hypothetical protein
MTAQEAYATLLKEEGQPLSPRELARRALQRGLVSSASKDPVFSIATTVAKNIRDGAYNRPELVSIRTAEGRKIGLPEWNRERHVRRLVQTSRPSTITLPPDIAQGIRLAVDAGVGASEQDVVVLLVKRGLAAMKKTIRAGIREQLRRLDAAV